MSFRVSARAILHLGRDLISSDFVAVYELMKNGIDATRDRQASDIRDGFNPPRNEPDRVELEVLVRIPHDAVASLKAKFGNILNQDRPAENKPSEESVKNLGEEVTRVIDPRAPGAAQLTKRIKEATTYEDILRILEGANILTVRDWGKGMSLTELNDVYLLIGTANRVGRKDGQVYFGEKGIGRLSAMRLGDRLHLRTTKRGEKRWSELEIDWRRFERSHDDLIHKIPVKPRPGGAKDDPDECGTCISVTALRSSWDEKTLPRFARENFSRLVDPFVARRRRPVRLIFNGGKIRIPSFNRILFKNAHAVLAAKYTTDPPFLTGEIEYRGQKKCFNLEASDLISCADRKRPFGESEKVFAASATASLPPLTLDSLGPFDLRVYWYNRRILKPITGIGGKRDVQNIVNHWSGGVMVFRDGFRVLPYGSPDDDWLDLDKAAFAAPGYKINRRQVIGRIRITRSANEALADQTNREGIRDSPEKFVLVAILQYVLRVEMKTFLDRVDREIKQGELQGLPEIKDRWNEALERLQTTLSLLWERFPQVRSDKKIMKGLSAIAPDIEKTWKSIEDKSRDLEEQLGITLNLAGIGLALENIEHELSRSIAFALKEAAGLGAQELSSAASGLFESLRLQLLAIEKRLLILKPMSTARRGRKKYTSVLALIRLVLASRKAQFERHGIDCQLLVLPGHVSDLKAKLVEGQIVQIFENLFDNSVYWLREDRRLKHDFKPVIRITVDAEAKIVGFFDNGRGVPVERREEVFQPFFSMKPAKEKKGLGLYISREIADYHGMSLFLSGERGEDGRLHTFILSLEEKAR